MRTYILALMCILLASPPALAENERYYQDICAGLLKGKVEVYLSDKTRIDILTDSEAIEVDWARKWAEGIGQALHYSTMTKKHAGLILIKEGANDDKYVKRVRDIIRIKSLRISLYVIDTNKKELIKLE